jgi:hypothetical protein
VNEIASPVSEMVLLAGALLVLNGMMLRNPSHLVSGTVFALMGFGGSLLLGPGGGWLPAFTDWTLMVWVIAADVLVAIIIARSRARRTAHDAETNT